MFNVAINWAEVMGLALPLLFIFDPLGLIPVINNVLGRFSPEERIRIIRREAVLALLMLLVFLFLGQSMLSALGLGPSALNIGGAIILFVIAIKMLFPGRHTDTAEEATDPLFVPIAMPLIAGPSAIAIIILKGTAQPDMMFEWTLGLMLAWGIAAPILIYSPKIVMLIGTRGLRALERFMGMILIMISVQMFLNGMASYIENQIVPLWK